MQKLADFQGATQHFLTGLDVRAARIRLTLESGDPTRRLASSENDVAVGWTKGRVLSGLKRRCRVRSVDKTDDGWMIGAADRESGLKLVVFLERAESRGGDRLSSILFAAAFAGPNNWKISEEQKVQVARQFADDPILVDLDDGVLFIFASPNMEYEFHRDLFDAQLTYFLGAMRTVEKILAG